MVRLDVKQLKTRSGGPFSMEVERGQCIALSGPSGCGKTLLLRALADLDPAGGEVWLDGEHRDAFSAPHWRRQVSWLPAESVWWHERVGQHFSHAQDSGPGDRPVLNTLLDRAGFGPDVLQWPVDRLSTGEKQRLALCRILVHEPKVLLLDEPTAALDRSHVRRIEEVIADVRRTTGAAVVWVSHDPEQIERTAAKHLRFSEGRLEAVHE